MKMLLALAVVAMGCGVSDADVKVVDDPTADDSFELSTTRDTFARFRRDQRRCVSPLCGGYWVKDLNSTMQERYVSGFDFSGSTLTEADLEDVLDGPEGEVVVVGRLGPKESRFDTRPLLVKGAYRALPGNTVGADDKFYLVAPTKIGCLTTPCANLSMTRVNRTTGHAMGTEVNLEGALKPLVPGDWLMGRVMENRAVVAGRIERSGGNVVLRATQVFTAVPDRVQSCPKQPPPRCSSTKVGAWALTENRCAVPVGCTVPGVCAAFVPSCESGYTAISWMNVCTRWACQPSWLD